MAALPHTELAMMRGAGHAPFWEQAAAFNERVATFCERLEVRAV
jgi:pimeloyl-ACP methyl ester carboxylesterase